MHLKEDESHFLYSAKCKIQMVFITFLVFHGSFVDFWQKVWLWAKKMCFWAPFVNFDKISYCSFFQQSFLIVHAS